MTEHFGRRLQTLIQQRGQLCVGIDPHPALLLAWGLEDTPQGAQEFSRRILAAAADEVPAVKPQVALFERFGAAGFAVLEQLLADCREAGVLSIADAKRGDIGSTMQAYAKAWLDPASPLAADALTVSPYLGFGSLTPALEFAQQHGKGCFVLALTSNPEGASVQHLGAQEPDGAVAAQILHAASERNAAELAVSTEGTPSDAQGTTLGSTGVVIGATVGKAIADLDLDLPGLKGPILVPGVGAQGGTVAEVRQSFGAAYAQVLINSSRALAAAGPEVESLRTAVKQAKAGLL